MTVVSTGSPSSVVMAASGRASPPDDARRAALRSQVSAEGLASALPFLEAVGEQVGRLRTDKRGAWGGTDPSSFARAWMLVAAARAAYGDEAAIDAPARALLDEPAMYAAFVQNLDLLYAIRCPAADAVSYLLAAALNR